MPRGGSVQDIVWWQAPACFVFHVMNAWEEGDDLFLDVMQFERPPLFPLPDGQPAGDGNESARLTRWRIDLRDPARPVACERLREIPGEFPRIDERCTGRPYRHGWHAGSLAGAGMGAIVHVDHQVAQSDVYALPAGDSTSEPVFVPRADDAAEGDGWLLAVLYRGATRTSELAIFDACHVAAGPVCTAALPHRVPDGFHGNWFAG